MRFVDELTRATKKFAGRIAPNTDIAGEGQARQRASDAQLDAISNHFGANVPDSPKRRPS
ncbi:MAG: hypothetical protein JWL83_2750 [Actinomycetia bacterium]|jgi:hypothetical protein|nr:hypothetical protein [Actinomycetes bacterium]